MEGKGVLLLSKYAVIALSILSTCRLMSVVMWCIGWSSRMCNRSQR